MKTLPLCVLVLGYAAAWGATAAEPKCPPESFEVKNTKFRREYDNIVMTATIVNKSTAECGVQLKASTYDKASAVVDTSNFWPASVRNIPPGGSENFKSYLRYDKAAANYDVVPIDSKAWR